MEIPYSGTTQRPPTLDGSNYAIWKVRMRVYIKSIDEKAWQRVLQGWSPPRKTDGEGNFLLKPETDWNAEETAASNMNNKALNVIFTSLDSNMFALVTNCVCAKQAWEKLQMHCDGSESVRRTKRRILTTQFENLRMEESETIDEYERRLRKIENEAIDLGDAISNKRLVSKVLRSLPERFQMKICVIDESKDTSILSLDELMSSLRTYELDMNMGRKDKGFGHYANECPTRLRRGMNASLSDDEVEEGIELGEEETHNALTVLMQKKSSVVASVATLSHNTHRKQKCWNASVTEDLNNQDADEDELSLKNVQKMYEELFADWVTRNKSNSALSKENSELKAAVARLEVFLSKKDLELYRIKVELGKATATLAKFNSSKVKLESILMMGQNDRTGLGFENNKFEVGESSKTVFVKENNSCASIPSESPKPKPIPLKVQVPAQRTKHRKRREVLSPVFPTLHQNTARKKNTEKNIWVPKAKSNCNVVFASLKTNVAGYWYFDSGSSRHMTGSKKYLADYVEQNKGKVTYGGGANGKIVGRGTLNVEGLPKLHNVLHAPDHPWRGYFLLANQRES
ncbi:uncharacterized protein [Henckelia pumila]|uniref:uncharacterized protein n=1 Tax=Henckelia pumila TaxID=405737 RepID=UPI003C6DCF54